MWTIVPSLSAGDVVDIGVRGTCVIRQIATKTVLSVNMDSRGLKFSVKATTGSSGMGEGTNEWCFRPQLLLLFSFLVTIYFISFGEQE